MREDASGAALPLALGGPDGTGCEGTPDESPGSKGAGESSSRPLALAWDGGGPSGTGRTTTPKGPFGSEEAEECDVRPLALPSGAGDPSGIGSEGTPHRHPRLREAAVSPSHPLTPPGGVASGPRETAIRPSETAKIFGSPGPKGLLIASMSRNAKVHRMAGEVNGSPLGWETACGWRFATYGPASWSVVSTCSEASRCGRCFPEAV